MVRKWKDVGLVLADGFYILPINIDSYVLLFNRLFDLINTTTGLGLID